MAVMSQQVLEQIELAAGEIDQPVAADDPTADEIELEIGDLEPQRVGRSATTQQGANPGEELRQRERLHQVVTGAEIEPEHAIVDAVARGENQDRGIDAPPTEGLQNLQ